MRKPTYEELRKLAAMYEPPRKPRRSAAAVAMVTVFLVGATAGLGGAWWMTSKDPHQAAAIAAHKPNSQSAGRVEVPPKSLRVDGDRIAGAARGMNPEELPFDGKKQAAAVPKREPAPAITPGELPYGGQSSGSGSRTGAMAAGAGEPDAAATPTPTSPPMASMSSMSMPPAAKSVEKPVSEDKDIAGDINGDKAVEMSGNNSSAQQPVPPVVSKEAMKPKPRRQPDSRELDRIRQQATEELRRKNEAKRMPNEARAKQAPRRAANERVAGSSQPAQSRTQLVRAQLAACENAGNFLLREQCKWQLCSGNWGKNGCPSYSTSHSAAY
jgi:hypothetical protein